jgi:hypothetical protein
MLANAGIHAFVLMAIIGEITCLLAALIVAPAPLALWRPRAWPLEGQGRR